MKKNEIKTLPQIIEWASEKFPDNEAFIFNKQSLSYNELFLQSAKVAQFLMRLGVKKGDRIGIYLYRSLEVIPTIFGVLRSGAAYVPLDPFAPLERTKACILDCDIKFIMTNQREFTQIEQLLYSNDLSLEVIIGGQSPDDKVISWEEVYKLEPYLVESVEISEDDLSYILYTSGSTGTPKGITHTHKSGLSFARIASNAFELTSDDKIGNFSPLHFDPSAFGYFSGPLAGATTLIIPEPHLKLPASLSDLPEREKPTVLWAIPYIYNEPY